MCPKRKKSKPNPEETAESRDSNANTATQHQGDENTSGANGDTPPDASPKIAQATTRSSWYGSFRSKALPATAQTSRESISVAQGATSESSTQSPTTPNSIRKYKRGSSRKSIPLAAEATRVHATSDASTLSRPRFPSEEKLKGIEEAANESAVKEEGKELVREEAQLPPEPITSVEDGKKAEMSRASWFGWWSRPDDYGSDAEKSMRKKQKLDTTGEEASNTPLPRTPTVEASGDDVGMKNAKQFEGLGDGTKQDSGTNLDLGANQVHPRSWFWLWSSSQNQQAVEEQTEKDAEDEAPQVAVSIDPPSEDRILKPSEPVEPDDTKEIEGRTRAKSSGWAFWQSDKPKDPAPTPGGTQKQVGELAVADTPSQSSPEAAQFNEQREQPKQEDPKRPSSLLGPKGGKSKKSLSVPTSAGTPADSSAAPTPETSQVPTPSGTPPPPSDTESSKRPPKRSSQQPTPRPNLILPSFRSSFPPAANLGYIERLTQYLAQSLHLPNSQSFPQQPRHVSITPSPPKIRKAVALGIHGFFPAPLIQRLLGQPTGTSMRFANYAATALKTWSADHQPEIKDVEVEKVALEGEGYVADRVATLWKLLLNWLKQLSQADCILVACHSQGVPVAVMLVAKLIQLGCLKTGVRIGLCAMAGINLGPFLEYKSRFFSGTALELFDFCNSDSKVSQSYASSIDTCLRHAVRITFVGSLDDQLVSLESSLHAPLSHPYVARAVFVDGRMHAPNFLTHLVVFALKLRNLGLSDHGLLRELSVPLAGSLVGGEGHSRVYDEPDVYKLAVEFALESADLPPPGPPFSQAASSQQKTDKSEARENLPVSPALANALPSSLPISSPSTTSLPPNGIPPQISNYDPPPNTTNTNPFTLPWAVRGMLEEPLVKQTLRKEVEGLVGEFEKWRPTSRVLRDVRWRLEGVRNLL